MAKSEGYQQVSWPLDSVIENVAPSEVISELQVILSVDWFNTIS